MNFVFSKKLLYCYIVILLITVCFLFVNISYANSGDCVCTDPAQITPQCKATCNSVMGSAEQNCRKDGTCELNDFMRIVVFYGSRLLGLVGSIALLMIIYGGIMFLFAAGNNERVTKAKQIIIGAVIGLVIVFTSYIIIGFVFKAMGIEGEWFRSNWFSKLHPNE